MKTNHYTYYECETCGTEYKHEKDARKCEASTPPCEFKIGQLVYLKESDSGFTKHTGDAVEIRKINLLGSEYHDKDEDGFSTGHHWEIELGLVDEYGQDVTESPECLEAVPPAQSPPASCPDCGRTLWTKESAEGRYYDNADKARHTCCLSKAEDVYPKGVVECRDRVIKKLRTKVEAR